MPTRKASPQRKPHHRQDEAFAAAETSYAAAMTLFTRHNWAKARDAFKAFLDENKSRREFSDMVDRAESHMRVCEAKLAPAAADPTSAEEWLLQGVAQSNAGESEAAVASLDRALDLGADPARVHYARSAALAVAGRHDDALVDLEKAIDADPANRFYSLTDPDFEDLRETAGYVSLVEPPRNGEDDDDMDDEDDDDLDDDLDSGERSPQD